MLGKDDGEVWFELLDGGMKGIGGYSILVFRVNQRFMCDSSGVEGMKVGGKALLHRPNGSWEDFEKCFFL